MKLLICKNGVVITKTDTNLIEADDARLVLVGDHDTHLVGDDDTHAEGDEYKPAVPVLVPAMPTVGPFAGLVIDPVVGTVAS